MIFKDLVKKKSKKLATSYCNELSKNLSIDFGKYIERLAFELYIFQRDYNNLNSFIDVGGGDGLLSGLIKFSYPEASCYVVDDFKDH